MKMNNILKTTALLLGSSVLLSGCIKETFPESGYATSDQTAESPFAKEGLITAMPTVLITNYIDLGEHIDFGYPGIFGATDRMVGEVFPVSGNLRRQPVLRPLAGMALSGQLDRIGSERQDVPVLLHQLLQVHLHGQ